MKSVSALNVQEPKEKGQKKHSKRLSNLIILNCSKLNFGWTLYLKWLAFQLRRFFKNACEQKVMANKYCTISRLHSLEQKESSSSLLFENDLVSFKVYLKAWLTTKTAQRRLYQLLTKMKPQLLLLTMYLKRLENSVGFK